jgi:hypothetical protein
MRCETPDAQRPRDHDPQPIRGVLSMRALQLGHRLRALSDDLIQNARRKLERCRRRHQGFKFAAFTSRSADQRTYGSVFVISGLHLCVSPWLLECTCAGAMATLQRGRRHRVASATARRVPTGQADIAGTVPDCHMPAGGADGGVAHHFAHCGIR